MRRQTVSCSQTSLILAVTNAKPVAAMNKDEVDALEDLKETNQIITSSLNNDLQLVQSRHKNLITDYDQQRAHLVDALLDRENLRKDLEVAKRGKPILDPEPADHDRKITEEDAAEDKAKTASQALKEVSHESDFPMGKQPSKRSFWKRVISPISPRPRNPHIPHNPHDTNGKETQRAVELAHERQAIGTLLRVESPALSLPRPMSPSPVRGARTDVYRLQAKHKVEANIPRSIPKSKK